MSKKKSNTKKPRKEVRKAKGGSQDLSERGRERGNPGQHVLPDDDFSLESQTAPSEEAAKPHAGRNKSATPAGKKSGHPEVLSYRHQDKRKNNPEVGMVKPENDPDQPRTVWNYDPHLDPALQFDTGRAAIEKLIDEALASGDDAAMRAALQELKRLGEPYLNWTGKAERTSFEVDTVSLHVHERIDPASILSAIRKNVGRISPSGRNPPNAYMHQPDLFAAPFENLPLRDAIDFYKHERGWANRLIAGDSLLVMNSLLQKESLAGQVQMIYIDPPYGIKYGSNFQPFVNKRDVKDRKDEDLTQEPEMIKAFRDTWELGIHSYLTYLRDRLLLAKDLLHESGSVFVQISDENLHHATELCDEIFGPQNRISIIAFKKTNRALGSKYVGGVTDYIIWYAKDELKLKFRTLFELKEAGEVGGTNYQFAELTSGQRVRTSAIDEGEIKDVRIFSPVDLMASFYTASCDYEINFQGRSFTPRPGNSWATHPAGTQRLAKSARMMMVGERPYYVAYLLDYPVLPLSNLWTDTRGEMSKIYTVQTTQRVIERCLLMTTDPGDLVLDPTCGSGTTAYVAEKWGRRWITTDTSRVAVTLAKQRLMTASYDYYALRYPQEGLKGGFIYKTVPHVTLKSIANNPEIDEIHARMYPAVEVALDQLNEALGRVRPTHQKRGAQGAPYMNEWEVPFDFPEDWPQSARKPFEAFHAARQAMQKQMDASIAAHADQETLYDQPQPDKNKLRITGPFTVEAVPFPTVLALDEAKPAQEADVAIARSGESWRQHQWRDELLKAGIRGKGGQMLKFAELETFPASEHIRHLHCSGTLAETGERVVVSFGPEHAALEQRQVKLALDEAEKLRPAPKFIIFASFEFDPEAGQGH